MEWFLLAGAKEEQTKQDRKGSLRTNILVPQGIVVDDICHHVLNFSDETPATFTRLSVSFL